MISILVEDLLSDIKKQIEDNAVGWAGQALNIIQAATQFFEELKTTSKNWGQLVQLVLQIKPLQEHKMPSFPLYKSPNLPYSSQKTYRYFNSFDVRKQKFLGKLAFFLCAFEMPKFYLVFSRNQGNTYQKGKKKSGLSGDGYLETKRIKKS